MFPFVPWRYSGKVLFLGLSVLFTSIFLTGQESSLSPLPATAPHIRYILNPDDSYSFYASNPSFLPYTLRMDFPVMENLVSSETIPLILVLQPGELDKPLLKLKAGSGERTGFVSDPQFIMGNALSTTPSMDFPYLFPYAHGSKFEVSQGFKGPYTHQGTSQYAVDFVMPEGTPVHAARDGIVADTRNDSSTATSGLDSVTSGNFVTIWHADGTFANYEHLRQDGILVRPGEAVVAGQLIAYSGNTGRSNGPHLHFDVRIPGTDGKMKTIPFSLVNHDGKLVIPVEYGFYYSTHPGQATFPITLGSLFTNEDFSHWIAAAGAKDAITMRSELIDHTRVLFVSNGFSHEQTVEVELRLLNATSSRGRRFSLSLPANSEVFAAILQPVNPADKPDYQVSFRY